MTPSKEVLLSIQINFSKVQAHKSRLQEPVYSRVSLIFVLPLTVELSCHDTLTRSLPSTTLYDGAPNKTATVTRVSRPLLTLPQCFPTTLTRLPCTLPVLRTFLMILDQIHTDGSTNTGFTVLTRSTPSWNRSSTTRLTSIMTVSPL